MYGQPCVRRWCYSFANRVTHRSFTMSTAEEHIPPLLIPPSRPHMGSEDTSMSSAGSPSRIHPRNSNFKKKKCSRSEIYKKTAILSTRFSPVYWQLAVGLLISTPAHHLSSEAKTAQNIFPTAVQWLTLLTCSKKRHIFTEFVCCNLQCHTHRSSEFTGNFVFCRCMVSEIAHRQCFSSFIATDICHVESRPVHF